MSDEIWTTKDGRKLKVSEMTDQHVRNTLNMILRTQREALAKLERSLRRLQTVRDRDDEPGFYRCGEPADYGDS